MELRELYPEGRTLFYEGDDPATFIAEMQALGINVTVSADCPLEHLEAVYGGAYGPVAS